MSRRMPMILAEAARPRFVRRTARSAVRLGGGAFDIAGAFQTSEQLVHRLLGHPGALGERARPDAVRTGILQHGNMRQTQLRETCGVQRCDDAAVNRLRRHAQEGADERRRRRKRGA
jgi:hypothetical protein